MKIEKTPVEYSLMHPLLKNIESIVLSNERGFEETDLHNVHQEVRYRLGCLQKESEDKKHLMMVMYKTKSSVFICTIDGETWDKQEIKLADIPEGLRSLFLKSYLENVVVELGDPICDYDLCQFLCWEADKELILPDPDFDEDYWL